ncbi:MAG: hypothetical protein ACEPOV_03185 [Hyphomicrobiales bacterium]
MNHNKPITITDIETGLFQLTEIIRKASNDNQRKLLVIYKRLEIETEKRKKEDKLLDRILSN